MKMAIEENKVYSHFIFLRFRTIYLQNIVYSKDKCFFLPYKIRIDSYCYLSDRDYINYLFYLNHPFPFQGLRVCDLVNQSNGKIMKITIKLSLDLMNEQEVFHAICQDHKTLQEDLKKILTGSSLPQQPTTTIGPL